MYEKNNNTNNNKLGFKLFIQKLIYSNKLVITVYTSNTMSYVCI